MRFEGAKAMIQPVPDCLPGLERDQLVGDDAQQALQSRLTRAEWRDAVTRHDTGKAGFHRNELLDGLGKLVLGGKAFHGPV